MLIIIAGPLGAGKTTISKKVALQLNGVYLSVDTVLADHGLDQIVEGSYAISLNNFVRANQLLQPAILAVIATNRPAVVDGCFYHREALDDLLRSVPPPHAVFTLRAPLEVCIERDRLREKPLGEEAARAVYHLTSKLTLGTVLDATEPIDQNVERITHAVGTAPTLGTGAG
ncbi:MAG: AAA family ATPase [Patescibacteria group bacterium]